MKLTVKQASLKLGVTVQRVRQLILKGKLPASRFGKSWVLESKDVEARIKAKENRPR